MQSILGGDEQEQRGLRLGGRGIFFGKSAGAMALTLVLTLTLGLVLIVVAAPDIGAQSASKKARPGRQLSSKQLNSKVRKLEQDQKALRAEVAGLRARLNLLLGPEERERRFSIPVGESAVRGDSTAAVTLVAFGDFQSDYTTRANHVVKRLVQEYEGKVRFVFKHYPLSAIHPQANDASLAALAAERQGKGWEMFDQLLLNSRRLDSSLFLLLAQQLGLDITQFDRDRRSLWALERLSQDEKLAVKVGVTGVPTFFLDGKRLASWRYDHLKAEVLKALRGKKR